MTNNNLGDHCKNVGSSAFHNTSGTFQQKWEAGKQAIKREFNGHSMIKKPMKMNNKSPISLVKRNVTHEKLFGKREEYNNENCWIFVGKKCTASTKDCSKCDSGYEFGKDESYDGYMNTSKV